MPQAVLKFYVDEPTPGTRPFYRATLVCPDWPIDGRIIRVCYAEHGWVSHAHYVFDVLCQVSGPNDNRVRTAPKTFLVVWDRAPAPDDCDYLLSCYAATGTFHVFAPRGSDDRPTKSD